MTVPNCTVKKYSLTKQGRREIEAIFNGGEITSDGDVLLLREIDRHLGLTLEAAKTLKDPRNRKRITHTQLNQLRQRVYALALGYEDLNDHHSLRQDTALQTALGQDTPLASSSTLSRFEQIANRQMMLELHKVLGFAY